MLSEAIRWQLYPDHTPARGKMCIRNVLLTWGKEDAYLNRSYGALGSVGKYVTCFIQTMFMLWEKDLANCNDLQPPE